MAADQLYYTSCRSGLSSGAGFQSRAASAGLGTDLRRQVERLSGYRPPDTLSDEPNTAQISMCPVSFRFARLDGGRWALTRSRYLGLDYSGRWGNFFSHTLVGPAGPLDRYPIDYYEWEGWCDGLSPGEDEQPPEPLPLVELDTIPDASSFTPAELAIFLNERPGRRERLANLIRAVLAYAPGKGRPIIIRDMDLNNVFWIACAQKALPLTHVQDLTFCTYLQESRQAADLNGTVEGTALSMTASDLRGRYCGFDELSGTASEVPGEAGDFGERMSHWLTEGEASPRQAFFDFLAHFNHRLPDVGLNAAVWLFELPSSGRLGGTRLAAALDFLLKHTQTSSWPKLLPQLEGLRARSDWSGRATEYENFLELLGKTAQMDGRNADLRRMAQEGWHDRYIQRLLEGADSDVLAAIRKRVVELGDESFLDEHFLKPRILGDILHRADSQRGLVILAEVVAALRRCGRQRPWDDPAFVLVIERIDSPTLDALSLCCVLAHFPGEAEALAEIAVRLAPGTQTKEKQRLVADALARFPEDIRQRVRVTLARCKAWGLLRAEWSSVLQSASGKDGALRQHGEALRRDCPEFANREWPSIATACWKELPQAKRTQVAPHWLDCGVGRLPPEIAQECVHLAASTVPLNDDPTTIARVEAVTREARLLSMEIPQRARLQSLLTRPADVRTETLAQVVAMVPGLEPAVYKEFLDTFLTVTLASAHEGEDVARLFASLTVAGHLDLLSEALMGMLRGFATRRWPPAAKAALIHFLLMKESVHPKGLAIRPATPTDRRDTVIAALKQLSQDELEATVRAFGQFGTTELLTQFEKDILVAVRRRSRWWPF
jgi:hypothetical protein